MKRIYWIARLVIFLGCAVDVGAVQGAELEVTPQLSLTDEPLTVRVSKARPGSIVTIDATMVDLAGCPWKSQGVFNADSNGAVDVAISASAAGSYEGVDDFGLLWSMKASGGKVPDAERKQCQIGGRPWLKTEQPHDIRFSAMADGQAMAPATVQRVWTERGAKIEEVGDGRLRGLYFEPAGGIAGKPAVLVISGSIPGLDDKLPGLIASHGFPALSLAYFGYKDLPKVLANIPLEYFVEATEWLRKRTRQDRVIVIGISRGTEPVQLAAAHFPKFASALILYVPSHLVESGLDPSRGEQGAAWTLAGKPVPFVPINAQTFLTGLAASQGVTDSSKPLAMTPGFLDRWLQPGAEDKYGIAVERIHVPILLLAAANDTQWPSWIGATHIADRIKAKSPGTTVEMEIYQGAGHGIAGVGGITTVDGGCCFQNMWLSTGGIPRLNAAASRTAFKRTLRFIAAQERAGESSSRR